MVRSRSGGRVERSHPHRGALAPLTRNVRKGCQDGSPFSLPASRPLPGNSDAEAAARRRRELAERAVIQIDDVRAAAGAPVDQLDVDAVAVAADLDGSAAPVPDPELRTGGRVEAAAAVAAGAGADPRQAVPRGDPLDPTSAADGSRGGGHGYGRGRLRSLPDDLPPGKRDGRGNARQA